MPTYIDESGDTGTKEGSTPYFRLAAVFFERTEHLQQLADRLAVLRSELGLPRSYEFHFAKTVHDIRLAFFEAVSKEPFQFVVSSFEKHSFDRVSLKKDVIRAKTIQGLITHLGEWYLIVEECLASPGGLKELIVYDQCDDPSFERALRDGFKRLGAARPCGRRLVRDIRPGKSKSDPGLQLVDMICGGTGKYLDGSRDYYNLIRTRSLKIEVVERKKGCEGD